mmetsp:Transcript_23555/g.53746  ORF Transcript_23555/g.53746 Transcript_23555/m.53746 type:complete len:125 (-) Transcript_23555:1801-2175(-)
MYKYTTMTMNTNLKCHLAILRHVIYQNAYTMSRYIPNHVIDSAQKVEFVSLILSYFEKNCRISSATFCTSTSIFLSRGIAHDAQPRTIPPPLPATPRIRVPSVSSNVCVIGIPFFIFRTSFQYF